MNTIHVRERMLMNDSIYIIVPHKNSYQLVEQFILFVREVLENHNNVYFVVIDDHSSDGTTMRLKQNLYNEDRLIFLKSKVEGVSAARNTGLNYIYSLTEVPNKWILFCDFDDMVSPNIFEQLNKSDSWKKFDYILFGFTSSSEKFSEAKHNSSSVGFADFPLTDRYGLILGGTFISQNTRFNLNAPWGKLISAQFLKQNEIYFDEELIFKEDLIFNLAILKCNPTIGMTTGVYYYYYINPLSTVRNFISCINEQNLIVLNKLNVLIPNSVRNKQFLLRYFLAKSLVETMHLYVFSSTHSFTYVESRKKFYEVTTQKKLYTNLLKSLYIPTFSKKSYTVIYMLTKLKFFNILFILMKFKPNRK